MPRKPWRTVHKSSNKIVMIRPNDRPRRAPQPRQVHTVHVAPPAEDWSWLWTVLAPLFLIFLVASIIIAYWEIILVGLLAIGIGRMCKQ